MYAGLKLLCSRPVGKVVDVLGQVGSPKMPRVTINFIIRFQGYFAELSILLTLRAGFLNTFMVAGVVAHY